MASSNYKLRPGKLIFSDAEFSPFIHGLIQDELFSLHELGAFGYSILVYLILYSGGNCITSTSLKHSSLSLTIWRNSYAPMSQYKANGRILSSGDSLELYFLKRWTKKYGRFWTFKEHKSRYSLQLSCKTRKYPDSFLNFVVCKIDIRSDDDISPTAIRKGTITPFTGFQQLRMRT